MEGPTGTLQRAAVILDVFEGADRLNLSQIVAATGLPRTSVHRALEQLVALRWVYREGMNYQLGMRMIELGAAAAQQNALRRAALPSLRQLHRTTGCVVHLAVRDGSEAVYLEKVGGEAVPLVRSRVGDRLPITSSTIGKALLALGDPTEVDCPELTRVRELRLAYDPERCVKGFSCVAVPIGKIGGTEAAALSVFGPADRVRDKRMMSSAQTAAAETWRRLAAENLVSKY
ncbi:IclR family transcriptional regulator [Rhodococcus sp. HNM0563]|uniref:IclR family transcriptional regulator n=1 Tax=unclassified Rhodococcus (in: high G+C Gram-positive bacteria) TaxID=192944 RepID=UPI00146EF9E2|nr:MULTISPECIES: IclR family transcriptional regulator [unclassified Rhodococcus (in: high G+C Gram-positive bacteria)]MCK0091829.1 IclR family transcriptional regulator [Rhodococcus sp. F64268]NLU64169.1 IclR family transcriptional regulator [Rhodococcus sp. HNM0563]